ncbi:MAG: LysM domain-containing protein [Dehalococcoidia bacterium]|nr:LysM domain-containing protein [Dehalococcoidia bacterium]
MQCFRCDQEAVQECPRCGALYCDDHGEALCERCMDPALAVPSYRVYRGSLLALMVGTLFAVWLLVRPPNSSDNDGAVPSPLANLIRPPAAPTAAIATATPAGSTATPVATPTPTATATVTTPPVTTRDYTVVSGDTVISIAAQFLPPGTELQAFVDQIVKLNNLPSANVIWLGQVLKISVR